MHWMTASSSPLRASPEWSDQTETGTKYSMCSKFYNYLLMIQMQAVPWARRLNAIWCELQFQQTTCGWIKSLRCRWQCAFSCTMEFLNPLNPELNPICHLLALLGAHHFLHVSRIRVKLLTFMRLMSFIYGAPILDVSRSHTTTQHSR